MNKPTKEALLYTRVSHEEQVKFGYSLDAQLEALKAYCLAQNLRVRAVFTDEGISGGTIEKRPQFKRMIETASDGDIILFTKLDRFSRNLIDANNVVLELDKKNVTIKAIQEDDIDTTTADGRFIFNLKLSLAQREREKTSERIREVFKHKNAIGEVTSGKAPFGYKVENKRLTIYNEKAEIIRFIFETYDLTNNAYLTHQKLVSKYGAVRSYRQTCEALHNEKYKGKHNDNLSFCAPIVTAELFDRVQIKLKNNIKKTPTNEIYMFSHLIKCPQCGSLMSASTVRSSNKIYHYYRCTHVLPGQKQCNQKSVREDLLEAELIDKLEMFKSQKLYGFRQGNDTRHYKDDIKKLHAKMERLKDLYIDGDIDKDTYQTRQAKFKNDLALLEAREAIANKQTHKLVEVTVNDMYHALTAENKSIFWHKSIKQIHITQDKHIDDIDFLL